MKLFPILAMVLLASCTAETDVLKEPTVVTINGLDLSIVEVDGCEYLYGDLVNRAVLTHKGNCKYCATRAQPRDRTRPFL